MLPAPSICPPERKKTSIRPCPAQSKSSRPPSVKKLCRSLERSETKGLPPPRWRARSAAVAGIGEDAPTATCRASPRRPRMTEASSSSSRQAGALIASRRLPVVDVAPEVALESLLGGGEGGVFG